MKASISTYTWDLVDEGIDNALDNIQNTAGLNDVSLAVSYHISTYFLPHNPKRQLYYGEDGMVLFEPNLPKYDRTKIRPRVSEVVDGPDFLKRQTDRIEERGLTLTAWIVYAYNHYLARTYRDCARQDALGNHYLAQLCVGNPDVRNYFLALTDDIVGRCRPDSVILESLSYREFEYGFLNPKVNSPITPWCQFLMGLCMCDHCIGAASKMGMDGLAFRKEIAAYLRRELAKMPNESDLSAPVTAERIDAAFDGQLRRFIDAREEIASSLVEEVVRKIRRYGDIKILSGFLGRYSNPVTGLSPDRLAPLVDHQFVFPEPGAIPQQLVANESGLLLNVDPTTYASQSEFETTLRACLDAGADGFSIYNYGLIREEHLKWIGAARGIWGG